MASEMRGLGVLVRRKRGKNFPSVFASAYGDMVKREQSKPKYFSVDNEVFTYGSIISSVHGVRLMMRERKPNKHLPDNTRQKW